MKCGTRNADYRDTKTKGHWAVPIDVRKSYAFPSVASLGLRLRRDAAGGVAAKFQEGLSEKHSFSAHRTAKPKTLRQRTTINDQRTSDYLLPKLVTQTRFH
jgi:hypothetical protein